MPKEANEITILHLSDLQFGAKHAFGRKVVPAIDGRFDQLLSRLTDDLGQLREKNDVRPDLVMSHR